MKPENIKKVWEHYRGFQIRYRIGRSQYIIDAFNKNMNGDFSPSLFTNPIESRVHLIVKEYIKCLLEQEALEQAQQEQTTIDTQQKSPTETQPHEQSTPTIEKAPKKQTQAHNSPTSQGRVQHRREGDKETHPQTQQPQAHKAHNSPSSQGGVRHRREGDKETHRKQAKARRAKAAHLSKGGCRSATEGIKIKPVREKLSLFPRGTRCLHRRGIKKVHNSPPIPRKGEPRRAHE